MCNRCTTSSSAPAPSDIRPGRTAPTSRTAPVVPELAPASPRWLPDPVTRWGATLYAFAGAVLWEAVSYTAHHVDVTITLV
ncbi:hypothetical protein Snoj_81210 [Streptomyces nojiriensis]|uniref:Uncharacterized protein n=1 Tax=Streptomyces nojiriensis TaxID=66374 RepID=A0ABQ3T1F4_9ACTN|nr:hypothetical protein [Streptomyces nojiriensis]QTI47702.1 hypothetical protein JYK04_05551 [Streptomyces nojiriensis]GGR76103.1 hypothetical protein GCM10010205_01100 [Streptomyces nojiriensis]GHI74203.1 hypothetical protein Snoj_81210 [Streptomyces nojiriensis]